MSGRIESGPFQERDDAVINNNEPQEWALEIASGAALSDGVELGPYVLCAVRMPAAFTGTTITFQSRTHTTAWANLVDTDGAEIEYTIAVGTFMTVDPADFAGCRWLRIRSDASGDQTTEGDDRTIVIVVRTV